MHYCYILYDKLSNKTYVGYTIEPTRRLRQHQGLLKGGAKYTSQKNDWNYLVIVASQEFTHNTALSFEWYVKHNKQYGIKGRVVSLLTTISYNKKFEKNNYCMYMSSIMENMILSSIDISILFNQLIDNNVICLLYKDFNNFIEVTNQ